MKLRLLWHKTYPSPTAVSTETVMYLARDWKCLQSPEFDPHGAGLQKPCSSHTWSIVRVLQLGNLLIAEPIIAVVTDYMCIQFKPVLLQFLLSSASCNMVHSPAAEIQTISRHWGAAPQLAHLGCVNLHCNALG